MQHHATHALAAALGLVLLGALAPGCARTDQRAYTAGSEARATFRNTLGETAFLPGCAPFAIERRLEGAWTFYADPFVCVWEGNAVPVAPGGRLRTPFQAPHDSGRYRLRYEVGLGCEPDRPLSEASCQSLDPVPSNVFLVSREACEPDEPDCRHVPAAPNQLCDDGVHFSGPAAECTRDPSSGRCGYEFLECP